MTATEREAWKDAFVEVPDPLSDEERSAWLSALEDVCLSSDGLIPFRDTIDRAVAAGVSYFAQPGSSLRDDEVTAAADEYGVFMTFTGTRLFAH